MIVRLCGILIDKSVHRCIVDVHGIGYAVMVPLSTFYALPDCGEDVTLHTHMQVRDDGVNLYGFWTEREREIFQLLIAISGIGPKQAINILSGIGAEDFLSAIRQGDTGKLTAIAGIGRKIAQRLILELKDRITELSCAGEYGPSTGVFANGEEIKREVLSALVNLGYKTSVAKAAIEQVYAEHASPPMSLDAILKEALRYLAVGVASGH